MLLSLIKVDYSDFIFIHDTLPFSNTYSCKILCHRVLKPKYYIGQDQVTYSCWNLRSRSQVTTFFIRDTPSCPTCKYYGCVEFCSREDLCLKMHEIFWKSYFTFLLRLKLHKFFYYNTCNIIPSNIDLSCKLNQVFLKSYCPLGIYPKERQKLPM